jgi:acetyl esterase/lipase
LLFSGFFNIHISSQQAISIWDTDNGKIKKKQAGMFAFLSENNSSRLSIIICPGGSYRYLAVKKEGIRVAEWLQNNGITSFVLRYRVGFRNNRHQAMIKDLQRTIQLVRENHITYYIDTCKIGVMGFSAGGHLAGTAATYYLTNFMEDLGIEPAVSLKPGFVAMIYPVVSMSDSLAHKKSRRNLLGNHYSPELQRMMSLEKNVHKEMPPMFMIHCKKDKTVDYRNALYYNEALTMKGVPCDFTLYDEGGHGFGINPDSPHAPSWINNFVPWLRKIEMR